MVDITALSGSIKPVTDFLIATDTYLRNVNVAKVGRAYSQVMDKVGVPAKNYVIRHPYIFGGVACSLVIWKLFAWFGKPDQQRNRP